MTLILQFLQESREIRDHKTEFLEMHIYKVTVHSWTKLAWSYKCLSKTLAL